MEKLSMWAWQLTATDGGDEEAIKTFTNFLKDAIKSIENAIASVRHLLW